MELHQSYDRIPLLEQGCGSGSRGFGQNAERKIEEPGSESGLSLNSQIQNSPELGFVAICIDQSYDKVIITTVLIMKVLEREKVRVKFIR